MLNYRKKEIKISEKAYYKWPDHVQRWTEEFDKNITVEQGIELYHASTSYIKAFVPKETCFSWTLKGIGYIYKITILKKVKGYTYNNNDEVRIILTSKNAKIEYIGYNEYIPIRDKFGRVQKFTTEFIPAK